MKSSKRTSLKASLISSRDGFTFSKHTACAETSVLTVFYRKIKSYKTGWRNPVTISDVTERLYLRTSYTVSLASKGLQQLGKSVALSKSNQVGVSESLGTDSLLIGFFVV